jgi:predicted ATPase
MLTELRFENFKSWRDTGVMRMAPLTGFFGTNSSGKTAILQFLLMLKQTVESNDRSQVLNFGNENTYTDLGTARSVIHQNRIPSVLDFSLSWQANLPARMLSRSLLISQDDPDVVVQIKFAAAVQFDSDSLIVNSLLYDYSNSQGDTAGSIGLQKQEDGYYKLHGDGVLSHIAYPNSGSLTAPVKVYGFPPLQPAPPVKMFLFSVEFSSISDVDRNFEQCFNGVYYLGPIRDYPKRFYGWSGEKPQDVGRRGENTIAALLTARKQDPEIEVKIAQWLKAMGLIDDFKVDLIAPEQRLYQASVRIAPGGTYCPITDVGFGISQILPVLVLCYYVPKGSTIIFEQPEIHLHPSAQQKLADVFIDVIKHRELQIIIESHSEHLLHRLQRRIAEAELTPEQAALYFCQMENDGASSLTSLELDEFGNITNWPEDFFGNEMEDLVAMTEAAMQRSMDTEAA